MDESAKAYKELYEILKYIPKQKLEKIPKGFIKYIETNMNKKYEYKVKHIKDFENQKMLRETKVLLAILYRDYWVNDKRKQEIITKQTNEIIKCEKIKKEKYDAENLFKKNK